MRTYDRRVKKRGGEVARVKAILSDLGILYCFHWSERRMWYSGQYREGRVHVYPRVFNGRYAVTAEGYDRYLTKVQTVQQFLSTVFHEVGHVMQSRRGRFKEYANGFDTRSTYADFKRWAGQALGSERDADRIGRTLMRRYFPRIPYQGNYDGPRGRRMVQMLVDSVWHFYFSDKKRLTVTAKGARVVR